MARFRTNTNIQELHHLGFNRLQPGPALAPWVESFWSVDAILSQTQREYLYPDGGSSLLFIFSGTSQPGVWFNAKQQQQNLTFNGRISIIGIRFKPGGAFALLGLPMQDLTTARMPAEQLPLFGMDALFEQLQAKRFVEQVKLLQIWLGQQAALFSVQPGPIQYLTQQLANVDTDLRQLLGSVSLGRRHIERLFRQQVGLSPNRLKMLLRIKTARYLIKHCPDSRLVDIALQTGHFDQAHFNHQFYQITGYTPGEYQQKQIRRLQRQELIVV